MSGFPELNHEDRREDQLNLGPNAMLIDLLRAVYRSTSIPLPVRLRAAIAALPHEVPRLAVTALVNEQSFAEILDRRLQKMEAMNGNSQPQTNLPIEAKPSPPPLVRRSGALKVKPVWDQPQGASNGDERPNRENAIQLAMFQAFQAQPQPDQHDSWGYE
jgi:hypothetical protein